MTSSQQSYVSYFNEINELTFEFETTMELQEDHGFTISAEVIDNISFKQYVEMDPDPVEFYNQATGQITLTIDGVAAAGDAFAGL